MNSRQRLITTFFHQRKGIVCLPVVWMLGVLLGVAVVSFAGDMYMIVNSAVKLRPDPVLLYTVNALPVAVLMALFAVQSYGPICVTMFLYGLFRGFCGMSTVLAFGSGGWLVRCLLMFSGGFVSVLMWWLIFSYFNRRFHSLKLICSLVLFVGLVTVFDYFVISPFLIGIC